MDGATCWEAEAALPFNSLANHATLLSCLSYGRRQVFQRLRRLHGHPELRVDPDVRAGAIIAAGQDLALSHVLRSNSDDSKRR